MTDVTMGGRRLLKMFGLSATATTAAGMGNQALSSAARGDLAGAAGGRRRAARHHRPRSAARDLRGTTAPARS
ncbi:hypothetical protein ABT404_23745 [Streptomyces hyaluromycini]|uniref:Uncharacterized protein n=1 Tax=Streptomyces hyaluromycini TaxID=1377993 RepID=A0ABV1X0C5_9ACTN